MCSTYSVSERGDKIHVGFSKCQLDNEAKLFLLPIKFMTSPIIYYEKVKYCKEILKGKFKIP